MFVPFLKEEVASIQDLFLLDEGAALYGFSCLRNSEDEILRDLSRRILDRKLFEYETIT